MKKVIEIVAKPIKIIFFVGLTTIAIIAGQLKQKHKNPQIPIKVSFPNHLSHLKNGSEIHQKFDTFS